MSVDILTATACAVQNADFNIYMLLEKATMLTLHLVIIISGSAALKRRLG